MVRVRGVKGHADRTESSGKKGSSFSVRDLANGLGLFPWDWDQDCSGLRQRPGKRVPGGSRGATDVSLELVSLELVSQWKDCR